MSPRAEIDELESALLERAKALAAEYLAQAESERHRIVAEANDRLQLREEHEILAAKAAAERTFRRRMQAAEIKEQEELDRLRWSLVRNVMDRLQKQLTVIVADDAKYAPLLARYLARAAAAIEGDGLIAEVNAQDHARLAGRWEVFCREAGIAKRVALAPDPLHCLGGVRMRNADDTVRVDNTFEGRMERMRDEIYQVVTERLFASTARQGALFGG